jgi:hypothetical protein
MDIDRRSVKLLMSYDPVPELRESYFDYLMGEFIPRLERLGLTMCESWHTAYGERPLRLIAFIAPNDRTMEEILASDSFAELEERFKAYVSNYRRRTVPGRGWFQF